MSEVRISYRATINACYVANFIAALVVNLTPILFIPLRELYGLSYQQLGFLVLINFLTQVATDILFSHPADKYGFRPFIVLAPVLTLIGFGVFMLSPMLFSKPYWGLVIGTIIFSGAGGLLELLLSPIINAIPTDEKAAAMSVLHSFYAWGQLTIILVTTLLVFVLGKENWQWIVLFWMILPLVNFFQFLKVPLAPAVAEEHRQGMRHLIRQPFFYVAVLAIIFGGAAEVSIAQWASAFLEKGMNIPKLTGDIAGMCVFALMLGVGRLLYGIFGGKIDVAKAMMAGSALAIGCYFVAATSTVNAVSFAAIGICGFAVSLLWPGTIVLAAARFPMAGAWMFAMLAAGGDIGASVGPYLVSLAADNAQHVPMLTELAGVKGWTLEQVGLRLGMLLGMVFPVGSLLCVHWIHRNGGE